MRSMSGMKPMSSMRVGFADHQQLDTGKQQLAALSDESSRRPGVAIRTSTPRISLLS